MINAFSSQDRLVVDMRAAGRSPDDIIEAMALRHVDTVAALDYLATIAPRRLVVNGREIIWRCPDDMVPGERLLPAITCWTPRSEIEGEDFSHQPDRQLLGPEGEQNNHQDNHQPPLQHD